MSRFEIGGPELAKIHTASNDLKWYCYFTGFLEGVISSGKIEKGEVEPLLQQCAEFISNLNEPDANDIFQDFEADIDLFESASGVAEFRANQIDPMCNKSGRNRFNGFCAGIACDGVITALEASKALEYLKQFPVLVSDNSVGALKVTLEDAVVDGVIDKQESQDICDAISRIVGDSYADTGLSSLGSSAIFEYAAFEEIVGDIQNCSFVLTGNFKIRPRKLIEDALKKKGGRVEKQITKDTTHLIVAMDASRDWIETHQGNKIRKAKEYYQKIGKPLIVAEFDVTQFLGIR